MLLACLMGSTNRAAILPREVIAPHRKGGTCIARLPLANGGVGIATTPPFEACNAQGASRGKGHTQPSPRENPHRPHTQPSEDGNPSTRRGRVVHIHDEGVQRRHAEDVVVIKSKHRDSVGSYDTITNKQTEPVTHKQKTCEGKDPSRQYFRNGYRYDPGATRHVTRETTSLSNQSRGRRATNEIATDSTHPSPAKGNPRYRHALNSLIDGVWQDGPMGSRATSSQRGREKNRKYNHIIPHGFDIECGNLFPEAPEKKLRELDMQEPLEFIQSRVTTMNSSYPDMRRPDLVAAAWMEKSPLLEEADIFHASKSGTCHALINGFPSELGPFLMRKDDPLVPRVFPITLEGPLVGQVLWFENGKEGEVRQCRGYPSAMEAKLYLQEILSADLGVSLEEITIFDIRTVNMSRIIGSVTFKWAHLTAKISVPKDSEATLLLNMGAPNFLDTFRILQFEGNEPVVRPRMSSDLMKPRSTEANTERLRIHLFRTPIPTPPHPTPQTERVRKMETIKSWAQEYKTAARKASGNPIRLLCNERDVIFTPLMMALDMVTVNRSEGPACEIVFGNTLAKAIWAGLGFIKLKGPEHLILLVTDSYYHNVLRSSIILSFKGYPYIWDPTEALNRDRFTPVEVSPHSTLIYKTIPLQPTLTETHTDLQVFQRYHAGVEKGVEALRKKLNSSVQLGSICQYGPSHKPISSAAIQR